jgi:hypothetical protein
MERQVHIQMEDIQAAKFIASMQTSHPPGDLGKQHNIFRSQKLVIRSNTLLTDIAE